MQNAYLQMMDTRHQDRTIAMINGTIAAFRHQNFPVLRICHEDLKYGFGPRKGTEGFDISSRIAVSPDDPLIIKHYGDAFNQTPLSETLKSLGVNTVFLCGLSATGCVLHTHVGAQNHDFHSFLLKGALLSPVEEETRDVERLFNALGWEALLAMTAPGVG